MQPAPLFSCLSNLIDISAENDSPLKLEPEEKSVIKDQVKHLDLTRTLFFIILLFPLCIKALFS